MTSTPFLAEFAFKLRNVICIIKVIPGVDFTNQFVQSANVPTHRVRCNQFHQQNFAQPYQYIQLGNTPNFYAVHSVLCTSKFSINILAQKLLIKQWLN